MRYVGFAPNVEPKREDCSHIEFATAVESVTISTVMPGAPLLRIGKDYVSLSVRPVCKALCC